MNNSKLLRSTLLLLGLAVNAHAQYTYTTNSGAITITGYTGAGGALAITNMINGLPVTGLGYEAFIYNNSLTSVMVPASITNIADFVFAGCPSLSAITVDTNNPAYSSLGGVLFDKTQTLLIQCPGGKTGSYTTPNSVVTIGSEAFLNCTSLTNVTIGASVTEISLGGGDAFASCNRLSTITVDPSNSVYSSVAGVLFDQGQTTLILCPLGKSGNYTIPNGTTSIDFSALSGCSNLTGVTIPNSVTSIGDGAFNGCSSLTNVTIPSGVTSIGNEPFVDCANLNTITVDTNNLTYSSLAGVLLNKSQTTLIEYPDGKAGSYTIPTSITSIGNYAFSECGGLTNITIPNSVTSIGDDAFEFCTNLTSVTIPFGVTSLGSYAFYVCSSLTGAYFEGNAPGNGSDSTVFSYDNSATAYYLAGATGFSTNYDGRPTALWTGAPYTIINVTANPSNGGTVSGGGTYSVGTNAQISATASNGWRFTGWSDTSTNNPDLIPVPTTNITYTASFATCTYALAAASTNVAASGGSGSVGVTAGTGCAWTATSNTNWIQTASSGTGNGTIRYTFDTNPTGLGRSGSLTVDGQSCTVSQAAATCLYTLAAASTNVTASAGSGSVGLTTPTGCPWSASSNTNWVHTTNSGTGSGTVSYTFDANPAGLGRSGMITVNGQTLTVNQAAATCTYALLAPSTNVTASAGSGRVGLTTLVGCAWTATNNVSWLTIISGSSGIGNGAVSYSVADNSGNCTNRSGTLTIGGQTFTVTQAAGSGSYTLASASTNVAASAGSGSVNLIVGIGCAWTASSSTNWIQTTSSGIGNGTVSYTFAANPSGTARSGTLTVQGQPFTITQAGATASILVQASPSNGGTVSGGGSYPVGTNVQIAATANRGWRFTGWSDSNTNATRLIAVLFGGATYTADFQTVVSNSAPAITSPPVVTNALLVIGNQFVIVVGETNVFNVGATDPVNNNLLRYQWNFGDGATSAWSAVALATHSYATNNCGAYPTSVTVSNTQFATRSNLTVSAACQLSLTKLQVSLNFAKTNADSGMVTAKLSLPGVTNVSQFAGATVIVDIGNAQVPFTLDAKGRGVSALGTCRLVATKPTKIKPGYWTATLALSKGTWRSPWANYGLDNVTHKSPGIVVTLPVGVLIGDEVFAAEPQLKYTATKDKTGTAK